MNVKIAIHRDSFGIGTRTLAVSEYMERPQRARTDVGFVEDWDSIRGLSEPNAASERTQTNRSPEVYGRVSVPFPAGPSCRVRPFRADEIIPNALRFIASLFITSAKRALLSISRPRPPARKIPSPLPPPVSLDTFFLSKREFPRYRRVPSRTR